LVLWRHGRTDANLTGRFQGQLDVPMDEVGLAQAAAASDVLAGRYGADALAGQLRIVSSDLVRASAMASMLGGALGVPVTEDAELRETHAGHWQGLFRDEVRQRFPDEYARWAAGEDVQLGGGESRSQSAVRAAGAIRQHAESLTGGVLVVAGHGAALRGAVVTLTGLTMTAYSSFEGIRNAHWVVLRRREASWVVAEYNSGATA